MTTPTETETKLPVYDGGETGEQGIRPAGKIRRALVYFYERINLIGSLLLLTTLLFGFSACSSLLAGRYDPVTVNIVMDMLSAIVVAAILIAIALDNLSKENERNSRSHRSVFAATCLAVFLFITSDMFGRFFDGTKEYFAANCAFSLGTNLFGVLCAVLTTAYVRELLGTERKSLQTFFYVLMVLGVLDMFAMTISLPTGWLIGFEDNYCFRGKYWVPMHLYPALALLLNILAMLFCRKSVGKDRRRIVPYLLLPLFGTVLQIFLETVNLSGISAMMSVLICYCGNYLQNSRSLAEKEKALADSRMNALLLQINPHFIYNTIGSIASCCHNDPEEAEKMLFIFSDYLRNNFGELAQRTMVPFETEAEHLDAYITIEKMRFPDIEIETDYRTTEFELPSLSVQPLVENAISHGIMGRESGGSLRISTYEDETAWYVEVEDDGVGFETLKTNDGRNHIGIRNVNERLQMLCGGSLRIESRVGVGTTARILIPKKQSVPKGEKKQ